MKILKPLILFLMISTCSVLSAQSSLDSIWGEWELDLSASHTDRTIGLRFNKLNFNRLPNDSVNLSRFSYLEKGRKDILGTSSDLPFKLSFLSMEMTSFDLRKDRPDTAFCILSQTDFFTKMYIEYDGGRKKQITVLEVENNLLKVSFYNRGILIFHRPIPITGQKISRKLNNPLLVDLKGNPKRVLKYLSYCRSCTSSFSPFKEEVYLETYYDEKGRIDSSKAMLENSYNNYKKRYCHKNLKKHKKCELDSINKQKMVRSDLFVSSEKIGKRSFREVRFSKEGYLLDTIDTYIGKKGKIDSVKIHSKNLKMILKYEFNRKGFLSTIFEYQDGFIMKQRVFYYKKFDEMDNWVEREIFTIAYNSSSVEIKKVSIEKRKIDYYY